MQRLGGRDDVGGRDLAQMDVLASPGQQQRVDPVEVHPDGVLVAGTAAGTTLAAGAQPVPDVGGHRRWQQREPWLCQCSEGRDPVIVQQAREPRISAVRVMLRSRRRRAAGSWDQAIMSPGWHSASTTASARLVWVMIWSFQPRALARFRAMPLACAGPGR